MKLEEIESFSRFSEGYHEAWREEVEWSLMRPAVQEARIEEAYKKYVFEAGREDAYYTEWCSENQSEDGVQYEEDPDWVLSDEYWARQCAETEEL